jgi:hypothetical protein
MQVSRQIHAQATLPPVPIGKETEWTPKPIRTMWGREYSWSYWDSNSDPSVVQLVANRYTDYAIPASTVM